MRNYEVMFVINAALEEATKNATIETVQNIIAANGEVVKTDVWGMRKLAYPIQKKTTSHFQRYKFNKTKADL